MEVPFPMNPQCQLCPLDRHVWARARGAVLLGGAPQFSSAILSRPLQPPDSAASSSGKLLSDFLKESLRNAIRRFLYVNRFGGQPVTHLRSPHTGMFRQT